MKATGHLLYKIVVSRYSVSTCLEFTIFYISDIVLLLNFHTRKCVLFVFDGENTIDAKKHEEGNWPKINRNRCLIGKMS